MDLPFSTLDVSLALLHYIFSCFAGTGGESIYGSKFPGKNTGCLHSIFRVILLSSYFIECDL